MTSEERRQIHAACLDHETECHKAESIRLSVTVSASLWLKSKPGMRATHLELLRRYVAEHDAQALRIDAAKLRMDTLLESFAP